MTKNLINLMDKEGNSLRLSPRVYQDRSSMNYYNNCWINTFDLKKGLISFMYEDGRIKFFKLDNEAQKFAKNLKPYSEDLNPKNPKLFNPDKTYTKST